MKEKYAGFGVRLVAALIDGLAIGIISTFVNGIFGGSFRHSGVVYYVPSILINIGYWVWYQNYAGQTFGKRVMHLKVVDQRGKTPSMGTLFIREIIGKWVSALILGIGYLMIIWDKKKQGLHDKIASTYVIYVK
ncbi:RDD family protein [Candidatus Daviesbacteria bacterium]|nr:RDD family protein [Candidatus Daviesbacteria bacterium]